MAPKNQTLSKLTTFAPIDNIDKVKEALFSSGAGSIGNYSECSFDMEGTGQFRPNESANPTIGTSNLTEHVREIRIEVIFPEYLEQKIIHNLKEAHSYEEMAYYISPLKNMNQEVGSGMIGELKSAMEPDAFLYYLKNSMNLNCLKHTALVKDTVKKIAICGGAGSFLTNHAIGQEADVFISSDFKYHDFFDADDKLIIADIGHYESEVFTKEILHEILSEIFHTFALNLSKTVTNPISYL